MTLKEVLKAIITMIVIGAMSPIICLGFILFYIVVYCESLLMGAIKILKGDKR